MLLNTSSMKLCKLLRHRRLGLRSRPWTPLIHLYQKMLVNRDFPLSFALFGHLSSKPRRFVALSKYSSRKLKSKDLSRGHSSLMQPTWTLNAKNQRSKGFTQQSGNAFCRSRHSSGLSCRRCMFWQGLTPDALPDTTFCERTDRGKEWSRLILSGRPPFGLLFAITNGQKFF